MAKFEITTPDGKKYEIEAADAQSANATLEEYTASQSGGGPKPPAVAAPQGLRPGTQEYADWAGQQARAGNTLPIVSPHTAPPDSESGWQAAGAIAPVQFQKGTGAWRWAVPGMLASALDAGALPHDAMSQGDFDPRVGFQNMAPETLDRAANAGGLMAPGATPGSAGRLVTTATGQRVPFAIQRALDRSGINPADAGAMVRRLGPEGRLIDIDDNLQLLAAAQANVMGPARTDIMSAMRLRAAGGNDRIKGALNAELGPAPNPTQLKAQISEAQDAVGPLYEREISLALGPDGGPVIVDLAPVRRQLQNQMLQSKGGSVGALNTIIRMLSRNDDPDVLENTPQALLAARNAIDGMIATETDNVVAGRLTNARQLIDRTLGDAVPAVKEIDAQYADLATQSGAIDQGGRILGNGPEAMSPDDLGDIMSTLAGPHGSLVGPRRTPSAAPMRLSQGTRAMLDRVVGTNANDRVKLRQLIAGEGSWNHQKLVQVFGQERADNIMRLLANESRMAESENLVLHGARTAPLRSAQEDLGLVGGKPGVVQDAMNFKPGDAAAKALDRIFGSMLERRRSRRSAETSQALLGTGDFSVQGARMGAFGGPPVLPLIQGAIPGDAQVRPLPPRLRLGA